MPEVLNSVYSIIFQMEVFPGFEGVVIIALLILIVILLISMHQKQVVNKELKNKADLIKEKAKAIEERNKILKDQIRSLKELNEEKNNMISVVSHDLKAPLNRIFALTNLLYLTSSGFNDEQKEYLEKLNIVVKEGLDLIRNLLDIRALEYKGVEINLENLDLKEVIENLIITYDSYIARKNQKILFKSDVISCPLVSDIHYLNRIFDNLISNAIKFSPGNTSILINCHWNDKHITVKVSDEGPGITHEDQSKLFQKFQVLSARPTGGESSTGLGLSITKYLVEMLSGEIYYEQGARNKGSTFVVKLPIHSSIPES